jgi:hypothetical protein
MFWLITNDYFFVTFFYFCRVDCWRLGIGVWIVERGDWELEEKLGRFSVGRVEGEWGF